MTYGEMMQTSGTTERNVYYISNGLWLAYIVTGYTSTLAALWLLSCWAVERPGSTVWPAINTTMSSCLNGPGPDQGWETHNGEQRPSGCYKRGGGENGRQQGQHDTKSIICFRANKPATVHLRISNLNEEKQKGLSKILLPLWAWLPLSDMLLFPFSFWSQTKSRLLLWNQLILIINT